MVWGQQSELLAGPQRWPEPSEHVTTPLAPRPGKAFLGPCGAHTGGWGASLMSSEAAAYISCSVLGPEGPMEGRGLCVLGLGGSL